MAIRISSAPENGLRLLTEADRLAHAGPAIQAILLEAHRTIRPRKMFLFGSRARGTARLLSDLDLAFEAEIPDAFPAFSAWVHEEAPTLLDVDVVDLERCDPELKQQILADGVLLYER